VNDKVRKCKVYVSKATSDKNCSAPETRLHAKLLHQKPTQTEEKEAPTVTSHNVYITSAAHTSQNSLSSKYYQTQSLKHCSHLFPLQVLNISRTTDYV